MTTTVAYLGIPGAFSEQATRRYFGDDVTDHPAKSFNEIFEAVRHDQADHGILPVENSLAGTVANAYELLTGYDDIQVIGEVILHIEHALLALPGVALDDVRSVRSHPQALAQCAGFLKTHNLETVNWYNTAGSAKDLAQEQLTDTAAIASPIVADLYGLDILARNIQDIDVNYTRFLVLGKDAVAARDRNKTSLIFTTRHKPGALVTCLQCISGHDLNLTKIESRPLRHTPWEYIFYVDFEGHTSETAVQRALADLRQEAATVRVLGSYPAAVESPEQTAD